MMRKTFGGILVVLLCFGSLALAQFPPGMMGPTFGPEADEWLNHVPDLDSVAKTLQATQNLSELAQEHPEIREQAEIDMGMDMGARGGQPARIQIPTLDEMATSLRAYPEAVDAIESSGLSVRDYYKNLISLVFGWPMFQADKVGMLDQMLQMMPGMKRPASLDFIRANEAEVQKLFDSLQSMGE